jgi:hypothetical protein
MADAVLRALAAGGRPGAKLADIIQRLVVKAAELGELETYQYLGAGGELVTGICQKPDFRRWALASQDD